MRTKSTYFKAAVSAAAVCWVLPALAQQGRMPAADAAAIEAQTRSALAEGAVATNRAAAIENLVSTWSGQLGSAGAAEQFRATLNLKSNRTLALLQSATTLDAVRTVLLGKTTSTLVDGSLSINNLGDTNNDLTYTPVNPPCRIVDTRNYGTGAPRPAGFIGNYYVYGSAALMAPQGGNAVGAGCPSPKGEPVGVAANFTAVPSATGHLRVYPFGGGIPTVSFLNFTSGVNIANAGIVSTGYLLGFDLVIHNFATTHHVADVMGYFYPVSQTDPSFNEVKEASWNAGGTAFTLISGGSIQFFGPTITHTVVSGDRVHLTANHAVGTTTNANGLDIWPCYRLSSSTGTPTTLGGGIFGISTTGSTRMPVGLSAVFSGLVGTYQYGLCYRTSSGAWNNNEWGYLSTQVLNF